ncbi:hypothetical protein A6R68_00013 [Neotoma lepida]|uniref:Small ribosomal subunit protein uS2 C-terminal domain-containing protein n=1 Tax=Neotoma lepida TaxID=56216 RepID=A0A1A6GZ61_NEOLE|nr:hypothetical protein A6R68_00013 [Neotoma lepida]
MAGALDILQMKEGDVLKFLATGTHLGGTNLDFQMEQCIYKRKSDGICIINLKRTWQQQSELQAKASPRSASGMKRALLKFAAATGATQLATSRLVIQAAFREPWLLGVTDPRTDHQSVRGICLPLLCVTDSPLHYVDIAIPHNSKGAHSVGLVWRMLAQEELHMPDLYFYRDPGETEKEEQAAAEKAGPRRDFRAPEVTAAQPEAADWSEGPLYPSSSSPLKT